MSIDEAQTKGKGGRKSWIDELRLYERYSNLSEDYFKVLKKFLKSKDKKDQQWAVGELSKAFVKMLPQDLTSGGEKITPILGHEFPSNDGDAPDSANAEENSRGTRGNKRK